MERLWRRWFVVYSSPNLIVSYRLDGTKKNPQFYCYVQTSWAHEGLTLTDKMDFVKDFYVIIGLETTFYSRPVDEEYQKDVQRYKRGLKRLLVHYISIQEEELIDHQLNIDDIEIPVEGLSISTPKGKIVPVLVLSTETLDSNSVYDVWRKYAVPPNDVIVTEEGNRWKVIWRMPFVAFMGELRWTIEGTRDTETLRSVYEQLQTFSLKNAESVISSFVQSEGIPKIYESLKGKIAENLNIALTLHGFISSLDDAFGEIDELEGWGKELTVEDVEELIFSGLFGNQYENPDEISLDITYVRLHSDIDPWIGGEIKPYPFLYGHVAVESVFRDPDGVGPLTQSLLSILDESLQIDDPRKFVVVLSFFKDKVNQGWIAQSLISDPAGHLIQEILEAIEGEQGRET